MLNQNTTNSTQLGVKFILLHNFKEHCLDAANIAIMLYTYKENYTFSIKNGPKWYHLHPFARRV